MALSGELAERKAKVEIAYVMVMPLNEGIICLGSIKTCSANTYAAEIRQ